MNPVPSYGGNVCCTGSAVQAGRLRPAENGSAQRHPRLHIGALQGRNRTEWTYRAHAVCFIGREGHGLYGQVLDVYPDGRAYNLDESIQRLRYRDGYDKPVVWMEPGKVHKVALQPLNTSNYFDVGHQLRIEISSSNFPRFDRNLNTGGKNYDEEKRRHRT